LKDRECYFIFGRYAVIVSPEKYSRIWTSFFWRFV